MSEETIISAKTADEFNQIKDLLSSLPKGVTKIVSAQNGLVGLECKFGSYFEETVVLYLPGSVTRIKNFDGYVGIYCGDFFFKADTSNGTKYEFAFLNEERAEKS